MAQPELKVHSPRPRMKTPLKFVASGTSRDIKYIAATLISEIGLPIPAKVVLKHPAQDATGKGRWAVFFKVPDLLVDTYNLVIISTDVPTMPPKIIHGLKVGQMNIMDFVDREKGRGFRHGPIIGGYGVGITPSSGNQDCLLAYQPYGDLTSPDNDISDAWVVKSGTATEHHYSQKYPLPEYEFWSVEFPDLSNVQDGGPGDYTLYVKGNVNDATPYSVRLDTGDGYCQ